MARRRPLAIDTSAALPPAAPADPLLGPLFSPLADTRRALQLLDPGPPASAVHSPVDIYHEWDAPPEPIAALSRGGSLSDLRPPSPALCTESTAAATPEADYDELVASIFGPLGPRGTVALACATFVLFVYSAVLAKRLPPTGIWWLDAVRDDTYYCYMVPLILPVSIYHIIWNWFGFKLFKHN